MSKKIKILLSSAFFFLFAGAVSAGSFPNNAVDFHFDSYNNQSCTSSTSVLMPAVNYDRTLLYFTIDNLSSKNNAGADVHLYDQGTNFPNQFVDNEKQTYTSNFLWHKLPANKALICVKGSTSQENSEHIFFRIIYTDYDLSLVNEYANQATTSTTTIQYPNIPTSTIATTSPNTVGVIWTLLFFVTEIFKNFWPIILAIGIVIGFCFMVIRFIKKIK